MEKEITEVNKSMMGLGALLAGLYGYNKVGGKQGLSNLYNNKIKPKTVGDGVGAVGGLGNAAHERTGADDCDSESARN